MNFCRRHLPHALWRFAKPNLHVSLGDLSSRTEMFLQQFFTRRKYSYNYRKFIYSKDLVEAIQERLRRIPRNFKNESNSLLKVWAHQCECVVVQRIRRSQQMFELYSKIWEEQAFKQFIKNIRQHLARRGKEFVFSAVGVSAYNWDTNRISEDEMRQHLDEIEYIKLLKRKTVNCDSCNAKDKSKVDKTIIAFCECDKRKDLRMYDQWSVFIEQQDLIVWRRSHKSGSFEYKVYGNYNDVTTEDFLSVQLDTSYRKQWDPTAVELEVIEKDSMPGTNSDIIYWEMQWPRLFANRDYVFRRRFLVDKSKKQAMMLSKATQHPKKPQNSSKYRVADYWSSMVIKPYTDIDKPGLEFSLTYFDNPGVNIPASVTAWVAYRAMPDFLTRLRAATLKYKKYCHDHKCKSLYTFDSDHVKKTGLSEERGDTIIVPTNQAAWEDRLGDNFFSVLNNELEEQGTKAEQLSNAHQRDDRPEDNAEKDITTVTVSPNIPPSSAQGAEVMLAPSAIIQSDQSSYWKYLQPTYYIS